MALKPLLGALSALFVLSNAAQASPRPLVAAAPACPANAPLLRLPELPAELRGCQIGPLTSDMPSCPAGTEFRPLGSHLPPRAVFVNLEEDTLELIRMIHRVLSEHHPQAYLNIIVSDAPSKQEKASELFGRLGISGEKVRLVPLPHTYTWMQDTMEFGVMGPSNEASVLPLATHGAAANFGATLAQKCPGLTARPAPVDPSRREFDSLNFGGNIEAFPGGIVSIGISTSARSDFVPERRDPLPEIMAALRAGNQLLELDTSLACVQHVDEMFSVVSLPNREAPCNFAIMMADVRSGATLGGGADALEYHGKALQNRTSKIYEAIERNLERLTGALTDRTGCADITVIRLPQMFDEYGCAFDPGSWPNKVNALVLGQDVILPRAPHCAEADALATRRLAAHGLRAHHVSDGRFAEKNGSIHCATNVLRGCR